MDNVNGDNSAVIERYQNITTVNVDNFSLVSPEVVLDSLSFIAVNNQAFINIHRKNFA